MFEKSLSGRNPLQELRDGYDITGPGRFADDFDEAIQAVKAEPTFAEALAIVVRAVGQDPHVAGKKLVEALGGFDAIAKLKPAKPVTPMPFSNILAVEVSIGDGEKHGPLPKTKRVRADRDRLRYTVTAQVWLDGAKSFSRDRAWKGHADLRGPDRALADIKRLSDPKRIHAFSPEYVEWLTTSIVPACAANDLLIGLLMSTEKGAGDRYHEGQIILMPRSVAAGRNDRAALLVSMTQGNITLPKFDDRDFKGASLGGTYVRQARGVRNFPFAPFVGFEKWATGPLDM